MEDALSKIEAKVIELQNTIRQQNALEPPQVVALGTVAENVEIVDESNLTIPDKMDSTVDVPPSINKTAESSSSETANEEVFNKVGDIMDEQFTCSICSELFVTAMTLNCSHTFCQYCINTWIKTKKECPVCRTGITAMNRSLVLDNFIDKVIENLATKYKKRRREIVDERRDIISNYQQTSANYQGASTAYEQTNHYYGSSTWSSSSDDDYNASNISINADSQTSEDSEGHVMDVDDISDGDQDKDDWDNASNISSNADGQTPEDPEGHFTDGDQDRDDGDNASNISSIAYGLTPEDPEEYVADGDNVTDGDQDRDDHSACDSPGDMDDEYNDDYDDGDEYCSDQYLSDD